MRIPYLFSLVLLLASVKLWAQTPELPQPFKVGTPFLDATPGPFRLDLPGGDWLTLAKAKGNGGGASTYQLERYGAQCQPRWSVAVRTSAQENVLGMVLRSGTVTLLINDADVTQRTCALRVRHFNPENGREGAEKQLVQATLAPYQPTSERGRVQASFRDLCASVSRRGTTLTPEYRYEWRLSPDQRTLAVYRYDYGQPQLSVLVSTFDHDLRLRRADTITVDTHFTLHDLAVNNQGHVFVAQTHQDGRAVVIRYAPEGPRLLEIGASNYRREDLRLVLHDDQQLTLVNTNQAGSRLAGLMLTHFDFGQGRVRQPVFHEITPQLRTQVSQMRQAIKSLRGEEDWQHYDLAEWRLGSQGELLVVLEKRMLVSAGTTYGGRPALDPAYWQEQKLQSTTETLLLFAFDAQGQFRWETCLPKQQQTSAADALNTTSYVLGADPQLLRVFFTHTETPGSPFTDLHLVELDPQTGQWQRTHLLSNPEKITPLRPYCFFTPDHLVVAGSKGLLGRSSVWVRYPLPTRALLSQEDYWR